jgi:protocatechuate 3,4-dioxygenase beta subunit
VVLRVLACTLVVCAVAVGISIGTAAATEQPRCRPTVSDGAGPFGTNAIATPRRATIGKGHVLVGRVLAAPDCGPVRRALVVFWQAGPNGYGPRGRGSVLTDSTGAFRIQGPVPANYGRGPHIHLAVVHAAYENLVTRYDVRPGSKRGQIRLVLAPLL